MSTQPTPAITHDPRPATAAESWHDAHVSPANVGAALAALATALPVAGPAVQRRDWITVATVILTLVAGLLAGNLRPSRRRDRRAE